MLGDMFSSMLLGVFGSIGYVAPVLYFLGTIFYASNKGNIRAVYKMLAVEVLLIVLCGLAQLIFGGGYQEGQTFKEIYETAGESGMGGGVIGGALVLALHKTVGATGSYILLLVFMILCLVCITERSFVMAVKKGSGKAYQYARGSRAEKGDPPGEERKEERLCGRSRSRSICTLRIFQPAGRAVYAGYGHAGDRGGSGPFQRGQKAGGKNGNGCGTGGEAAARRDQEERRAALGISPQPGRPLYRRKRKSRVRIRQMYSAGISPWPERSRKKETVPFDEDLSLSRPTGTRMYF